MLDTEQSEYFVTATQYRTRDGRAFDTEAEAKEHVVNVACSHLDSMLRPQLESGQARFNRACVVDVINALCVDFDAVMILRDKLTSII